MRKLAYAAIFGLFIVLAWALVVPDPTFPGAQPESRRAGNSTKHSLPRAMGVSAPRGVAGKEHVSMSYAQLPFAFELNRGQTDPRVMFVARGSGYTLFLASGEAVLSLRSAGPKPPVQRQMAGLAGRGSPLARPDEIVVGGHQNRDGVASLRQRPRDKEGTDAHRALGLEGKGAKHHDVQRMVHHR